MLYNIYDILLVDSTFLGYIPDYFMQGKKEVMDKGKSCDLLIHPLESLSHPIIEVASSTYRDLNDNSVIYSMRSGGIRVAWSLKNLEGSRTEVKISRGYILWSKLIRVPVGGILPLEIYLKIILHLKLISKRYAFLIAGCVIPANNDCAILICAPNAMGKTSLVLDFINRHEAKLVADDTVIVGGSKNTVLSYPQSIRMRSKLNFDLLPFTEKYVSPEVLFDTSYSAKVDALFFLEWTASSSIKEISYEAALARLIAINRKILSYQSENTITWYAGFNPTFKLESLIDQERFILSEFLKGKKCFVIRYDGSPSHAVNLIKRVLHIG